MERERDEADHRMRLLAKALGDVLAAAGVDEPLNLTGPELLLLADGFAAAIRSQLPAGWADPATQVYVITDSAASRVPVEGDGLR